MLENLTIKSSANDFTLRYREKGDALRNSTVFSVSLAERGVEKGARDLLGLLRRQMIVHPSRYTDTWVMGISEDKFVKTIKGNDRIINGLSVVAQSSQVAQLESATGLFGVKGAGLSVRGDKVSITLNLKPQGMANFNVLVSTHGMDRSIILFKKKIIEVYKPTIPKAQLNHFLEARVTKFALMQAADKKDVLREISDATIVLKNFFHLSEDKTFDTIGVQFVKVRKRWYLQYKRDSKRDKINEYFRVMVNWANPEHSLSEFINRITNTIGDYVGSSMRVEIRHRLDRDLHISKLYSIFN